MIYKENCKNCKWFKINNISSSIQIEEEVDKKICESIKVCCYNPPANNRPLVDEIDICSKFQVRDDIASVERDKVIKKNLKRNIFEDIISFLNYILTLSEEEKNELIENIKRFNKG